MKITKRLKSFGLPQSYQVELFKEDLDASIEGLTENLSQRTAFIKTNDWRSLQVGDSTILTFFLGPNFAAGFQGEAVVQEIDQENEGVMVEFVQSFKQFDPVNMPEVSGKARYKRLAFYFTTLGDASLDDLTALHPNGFLIEKSKKFFDENVMFQFSTDVFEDQDESEQLGQGVRRKGALGARVMEIKKRKSITNPNMITIGRSPENDIVLYNRLVSKSHAYLDLGSSDETIFLVDKHSTNGTFINNIELSPTGNYQLADGDEISFGPETKVVYFSTQLFHSLLSGLKSLD
jgi:hypothetical protein